MADPHSEFHPTKASIPLLQDAKSKLTDIKMSLFFGLCEVGYEPRDAYAEVANTLLPLAARCAVFSSVCANAPPNQQAWAKGCNDAFEKATREIGGLCVHSSNDRPIREDSRGSSPPNPLPRDAATGGESPPAAGAVLLD